MAEDLKQSIPLEDMSLAQLVMVSQGIGHQIEKMRVQRAYLKRMIDERIASGERDSVAPPAAEGGGKDGAAPGAELKAAAKA